MNASISSGMRTSKLGQRAQDGVLVPRLAVRALRANLSAAAVDRSEQRRAKRLKSMAVLAAPEVADKKVVQPDTPVASFQSLLEDDFEEYEDESFEEEVDESLKIDNLGLCPEVTAAVRRRGITALFPIQKLVFAPAREGRDLIARAKTGSGKTLAFSLPVIEALLEQYGAAPRRRHGPPSCIVLAPTRELANQVAKEFETVCPPGALTVRSFYGGTSIMNQVRDLERGVDVVVGTPGRIIDLIERGNLKLQNVRFAILDEADQMLDMGFEEDMETILSSAPKERQTMLFSATLPKWVHKVARKHQNDPLLLDLVGEENTGKLSDSIRLLIMEVTSPAMKLTALNDLMSVYAAGGKTLVFVNTKMACDEVAAAIAQAQPCEALHGDIAQQQREKTLGRFRAGDISVLVATDVAARGLDIPSVDLVVHFDLPQDNEAFLHRSGRTGRANNKGTAIVLYKDREAQSLGSILRETKVQTAESIGAPDPSEVMTAASKSVLIKLDRVEPGVIEFFLPSAEKLLASEQPAQVLAAALAAMSGFRSVPQTRSLLTGEGGMVTLRLVGPRGAVDGFSSLLKVLRQLSQASKVRFDTERVGRIRSVADVERSLEGVAFDVPSNMVQAVLSTATAAEQLGFVLDKPRSLPLDVSELMVGRRGARRPPRADRGRSSNGRSRDSDFGYGSSRDGSSRGGRGGYGSSRDGRSGRGGGGGSYGGGYGGGGGGGYGDSWGRSEAPARGGRGGGSWVDDMGWGSPAGGGGGNSRGRGGGSSSGGSRRGGRGGDRW